VFSRHQAQHRLLPEKPPAPNTLREIVVHSLGDLAMRGN
jgi:hypothetical protein